MALARLGSVALDCAEARPLAEFWAGLIGGTIVFASDDFVAVQADGAWITTMRVEDYQPTTWPEGTLPKQMHLDLAVTDLDAAQAEALRLGATAPAEQPDPERWRVLLDPAGHPFCVTTLFPE